MPHPLISPAAAARLCLLCVALLVLPAIAATAEPADAAWLRYTPVKDVERLTEYREAARRVVIDGKSTAILESVARELARGLTSLLDQPIGVADASAEPAPGDIVISVGDAHVAQQVMRAADADVRPLRPEGFILRRMEIDDRHCIVIAAPDDRGALYGAFALLRRMALHDAIAQLDVRDAPSIGLRMVNQWDNLDGSVERGYAGRSIFHWERLPALEPRYEEYARLLASVGINGICVNNVNAGKGSNIRILDAKHLAKAAALAEPFRRYGVRLYLAVGFNSPIALGGLDTADPLDPRVREWWTAKAAEIYRLIPDFGGFVVKADSEGQPGPYQYGRDHADGANMLGEALVPHGGLVIWRSFVYQNDGTDRAKMAWDHFRPLDGRFAENVIVQVKHGPLDFQVREPVNPLLGAMPETSVMLELQVTQEYTGHDVHLCWLVPMWKQVLDFDTHARGEGSTVARVVDGSLFGHAHSGITAVVNVGEDRWWLGHPLHMANLYGYGRLAWNPSLESGALADEWTRQTFGHDATVVETITGMLMRSWPVYEAYTSPMGLGVLHDPPTHFDPAPHLRHAYHRADKQGIGFDRTQATGSGYTAQYHAPAGEIYEDPATTLIGLLLFFHHLPWKHPLPDGGTVIQRLYDSYFDGVEQARSLREAWASLEGRIDAERHALVLAKLDEQVVHAAHWRDTMTRFLFELSAIPDEQNRIRSDVDGGEPE